MTGYSLLLCSAARMPVRQRPDRQHYSAFNYRHCPNDDPPVTMRRSSSQAVAIARTYLQEDQADLTCQPAFRDQCAHPTRHRLSLPL